MSKKNSKTFAIKLRGEYFEILRITRTKSCISLFTPVVKIHTTICKDGKTHATIDDPTFKIGLDRYTRITDKQRTYYPVPHPPFSDLKEPLPIESSYCFRDLGKTSPPHYEIIDLDAIECPDFPEVSTFLSPPDDKSAAKVKVHFVSERRIVKYPDVWVVLVVGHTSQKS